MEKELRGKKVMSNEGLYLGIIRNITVDERTGKLVDLVVEPSDKLIRAFIIKMRNATFFSHLIL